MREIKFRAWDKKTNQWFDDFHILPNGVSVVYTGEDGGKSGLWEHDISEEYDLILMQFTGLHDKNGKEIFEGDVVAVMGSDCSKCPAKINDGDCTLENGPCPVIEKFRDVATMNRLPGFWLEHEYFGYEGEELISPEDCIVLGNIYENPELIKAAP